MSGADVFLVWQSSEGLSQLLIYPLVLHKEHTHTHTQSVHVCGFHTETKVEQLVSVSLSLTQSTLILNSYLSNDHIDIRFIG